MGLDISHDTWHGAYSAFHRWREEIALQAGFPPLMLMEGFYPIDRREGDPFRCLYNHPEQKEHASYALEAIRRGLPIKWDKFKDDPLWILLDHSDCDGSLESADALLIAGRLTELLPLLPAEEGGGHIGNWKDKTSQFIEGCKRAGKACERLEFH